MSKTRSRRYCYDYPHPAVTVDCVVFGLDHAENDLKVLLIERGLEPFKGRYAFPGGFLQVEPPEDQGPATNQADISLDAAARRELKEETGIRVPYLEQLYTFGDSGRDPRGRVVTVAYYGLVKLQKAKASTDAAAAIWFSAHDSPNLAFDHAKILDMALERLRGKIRYQPIGFELLPEKFALRQLQNLYEIILNRPLDKRNFRKKILKMNILRSLDEKETNVSHRAATLYQFDRKEYQKKEKSGFVFEM